jgi:ABC-type dipeptide/oligopeptide/nickel transport system permease component
VDSLLGNLPVIIIVLLLLAFLVFTTIRLGPRFIIRRLAGLIFVLIGVTFITFMLGYFAPGSAIYQQLGHGATQAQINALRAQYGLDLPWYQQYGNFLVRLLHLNLGYSFIRVDMSVWSILQTYVPNSVVLGVGGTVLALFVGIPLGLLAAVRANSRVDGALQTIALILYAVPTFVIIPFYALAMVFLYQHGLPSLPVAGWGSIQTEVAPITIFALTIFAYYLRLTRASMLEVLGQDFVRTARAKGIRERVVVWRHAFRNAMIPLLTAIGPALAFAVVGVFIIEDLFNIPGIGDQTISSITGRDYPVVQATVILLALAVVFMNLITDIAYGYADPRIKTE